MSRVLTSTRLLIRRKAAISAAGCDALRGAVDSERDVTKDSVDNGAQHQLNIDVGRLTRLIGREQVKRLWRLADELLALQRDEAHECAKATGGSVPAHTAAATEAAAGGFHHRFI